MDINNKEILINERDDYYYDSFMWAVIAGCCEYYGWFPGALFTAGIGVLLVLIGAGISIWISHK